MVITITKDNFQTEVANSDKPVLIDFYADWCGPCKQLSPLVEEVSQTENDFKVCKVNVDQQPEIASAFAVSSIPMLAIIKDGKITDTSIGAISKDKLISFMHNNL